MHLYFVRHGLAHWPAWSGNDAERPLTPLGVKAIEAMGRGLARRNVKPDLILHSPLARAQQTAEIIAEALGLSKGLCEHSDLEPGFSRKKLKRLLKQHRDAGALMLVGHNPDMSDVVSDLTDEAVKFKEGTVACVKLREPDRGKLVWLATAEELSSA
jgi:phosphohistidine phosphatase